MKSRLQRYCEDYSDNKNKGTVETSTSTDTSGKTKSPYATCIRVFQKGNKVMEFIANGMKVDALDKEHIIFYNELGKRTSIYSNDGIIFVQFTDGEK